MLKKTTVVMLPTNEKAVLSKDEFNHLFLGNYNSHDDGLNQHLYFISDDEIKDGVWQYDSWGKSISKATRSKEAGESHGFRKIIATTDSSLINDGFRSDTKILMPQPSQGFLEIYVVEYNKGNQIKEVLVEYEEYCKDISCGKNSCYLTNKCENLGFNLKVNSKDNTITIKKVKESWSREEVATLINKFSDDVYNGYYVAKLDVESILDQTDIWIEQNL
jgi:hypothetical protein